MTDRRLLTISVLLALAIGLTQLLVWWLKPAPKNTFVGPPRSGYTLKQFTLDAFGDTGHLSFELKAPQLVQREGDDSLYLNAPDFLLPPQDGASGKPWYGHSQYGWVSADNTLLKLQGKVVVNRPPSAQAPAASMHTSDVTAWPRENRLATDAAAHIVEGTSTMSGVGLRANLATKHLELLNDFHGTFKPSSHH